MNNAVIQHCTAVFILVVASGIRHRFVLLNNRGIYSNVCERY